MDDSSRYNLPAYMPEHLDLILLENMSLEEILALEQASMKIRGTRRSCSGSGRITTKNTSNNATRFSL